MENNRFFSKVPLLEFLVAFSVTALGIITTYYTTIGGVRLDSSGKGESVVASQRHKRLSDIDLRPNENFLTQKEFDLFTVGLQDRPSRIESRISEIEKR